jgi:hypothetical protein
MQACPSVGSVGGGHASKHWVLPAGLSLPSAQPSHVVEARLEEKVPAMQFVQVEGVFDPTVVLYLPALQATQVVAPIDGEL